MKIAGTAAVVSGGGSRIGRAAVLALVQRGAQVVVADIDAAGGQQTVDLAVEKGGRAVFSRCDVTQTADLTRAFARAVEAFGPVHIAFNNAGIGGEDLFADDPGDWTRIIAIDLTAVIDATRIAVRAMTQAGTGGVIVNTASLIGLGPMASAPVYAAAKAGVVNFSRSLAHLARDVNIRVNAICPELVDTPMARSLGEQQLAALRSAGGILRPEAIAAGVVDLIEDDFARRRGAAHHGWRRQGIRDAIGMQEDRTCAERPRHRERRTAGPGARAVDRRHADIVRSTMHRCPYRLSATIWYPGDLCARAVTPPAPSSSREQRLVVRSSQVSYPPGRRERMGQLCVCLGCGGHAGIAQPVPPIARCGAAATASSPAEAAARPTCPCCLSRARRRPQPADLHLERCGAISPPR